MLGCCCPAYTTQIRAHLPVIVPGVLVLVPEHAGHHATGVPNMTPTARRGDGRNCADLDMRCQLITTCDIRGPSSLEGKLSATWYKT